MDDGSLPAQRHEVLPESPFALLDDEQTRAWYAYMKVHLRLRYEMNRRFREENGISLADYDILVALVSEHDVTLTMSGLATRVGWERSRVSHQVRRMTERGLLAVRASASDRRATAVSLSEAGRAKLAEASPSHAAFIHDVFLGALDEEGVRRMAESFELIYEELLEHGTLPRPADHP